METQVDKQESRAPRGERIIFYHPNSKGTGAATRLEPKVIQGNGDRHTCFFLEMASQKTAASKDAGKSVPATFDWENKITVKLGFEDICHFLAVLEGRADRVGGKRDGLYHGNGQSNALIHFSKHESGGCLLALSRKRGDEEEARRIGTVLSDIEATGLRHLFTAGLFAMVLQQCGPASRGGFAGASE